MRCRIQRLFGVLLFSVATAVSQTCADGIVVAPGKYAGSLEERAQEAIIIFQPSDDGVVEDLILKIRVEGDTDNFAWIIPFPNEPQVHQADAKLFEELYDYVAVRTNSSQAVDKKKAGFGSSGGVDVLSRETVGSFDVAIVREETPGTLNDWLQREGYRRLDNADDIIEWYRERRYVFACVKVQDTGLRKEAPASLHPLRFTFKTGGRDAAFFPMRLTALQDQIPALTLYVFSPMELNYNDNEHGIWARGVRRTYRDPGTGHGNGRGYRWSRPEADPFLKNAADHVPSVGKLFAELYPNERFILTKLEAGTRRAAFFGKHALDWSEDVWIYPQYPNKSFVPLDARPGGPAASMPRSRASEGNGRTE